MKGTILSFGVHVDLDTGHAESPLSYLAAGSVDVLDVWESADGVARVIRENPSIILLGDYGPRTQGRELLAAIRSRTWCPVLIVGSGSDACAVDALLQGADMYLRRPVENVELLVRIHALIRRGAPHSITPSSDQKTIVDQAGVSLTDTEARLFSRLMERKGTVVGHDDLMANVWGGPVKKERLRFYVHSLRRKLAETTDLVLETKPGFGYRIVSMEKNAAEVSAGLEGLVYSKE